ncbi:MAG: hypothetical protein ACD_19C00181G0005 [uncultured bacterium]|nr:MAG: hypothetical protein ACD_19C00181G0005 [uncultured bacterium]
MNKVIAIMFCFIISIFLPPSTMAYNPLITPNNIYGIGIINHSDLTDASNLVNVNSGDWGYVTIVITEDNRNNEVWQEFMDDCRRLHLIPIVRVASEFKDDNWQIPKIEDIDNWINFFNSLNWVVENRYIVIANEPNHAKEWGGKINPSEYANYLKAFSERLHNTNSSYFVLNAGLDQDAPNGKATMDEKKFIDEMVKAVPHIFTFLDGWNSHSYPNPGFSGSKTGIGRRSIRGYEWEMSLIKKNLPIFITETGWIRTNKNEEIINKNLRYAYEEVWSKDKRIVAVTPFLLNYQDEPFYEFSWKNKDGSFFPIYTEIQSIQKIKGEPIQKISGEVVFNFLNPLMIKNTEQKGFSVIKNTGQAIWTQSESNVINESENEIQSEGYEISVSNTKFSQIEPFSSGLVTYTLKTEGENNFLDIKLGFYVRGERIGNVYNGKIISF